MLKGFKQAALIAALAVGTLSAATTAQARDRYRDRGDDAALAIGAGIIGLAIGAAIASSNDDRYDRGRYYRSYPDGYYYDGYPRAYRYDRYRRDWRDNRRNWRDNRRWNRRWNDGDRNWNYDDRRRRWRY